VPESRLAINGLDRELGIVGMMLVLTPQPAMSSFPPSESFYVLVIEDDGSGKPIVFETTFPEGASLAGVTKQQQALGDRYGRTWIAKCEIMPATVHIPKPIDETTALGAVNEVFNGVSSLRRSEALSALRRFIRESSVS
jgi:hypothetical protein